MAVRFTDEQQRAIESRGMSACVPACAGSGKTSVLVERYRQLIEHDGVLPPDILAITFTDKAAQHMRDRVRRVLGESDLPLEVRQLDGARICTIHSFCKTILSEYPFEAGLTDAITVLDEGSSDILKMETLESVLMNAEVPDAYIQLMQQYHTVAPGRTFYDIIINLYDAVRTHGPIPAVWTDEKQIQVWYQEAVSALTGTLEEMLACAESDKRSFPEKKVSAIKQVRVVLESISLNSATREDVHVLYRALQSLGSSKKYEALFSAKKRNADLCLGALMMYQAISLRQSVGDIIVAFDQAYTERKREVCGIDFDDLMVLTYSLLTRGDAISTYICERLQQQFSHVLLDECQDTNALQFAIVSRVAREDNLFIVGDVQQSIYGFRGADVRVMSAEQKRYASSDMHACLPLSRTHRSTRPVVSFVNDLFLSCTDQGGLSHPFQEVKTSIDPVSTEPAVELHIAQVVGRSDLSSARFSEAAVLASRIRKMVEAGTPIRGEDGCVRPVRYGDIAILFRSMTNVALYEKVLRDYTVPYTVLKGGGFYSAREIADIVAFLKVLECPYEDIVCAAVLRSPLFGLSNDALYWLGTIREDGVVSFFDRLRRYSSVKELTDQDRRSIQHFFDVYYHVQRHKKGMSVRRIVQYVLDETGYFEYVLSLDTAERCCANIFKLQELAGRSDRHGIVLLHDFIAYIEDLERHEIEETEADIAVDTAQCVSILSVHRAKGLEFPVVCIADMGTKRVQPFAQKMTYAPEYGLGIQLWDDLLQEYIPDVAYCHIREDIRAAEREEDLRILYVACTRAQDRLMFFGSCDVSRLSKDMALINSSSWIVLVAAYLLQAEAIEISDGGVTSNVDHVAGALYEAGYCIPQVHSPEESAVDASVCDVAPEMATRIVEQVTPLNPHFINKKSYTVSEIVTFSQCPRRYVLQYLYPVPSLLRQPVQKPGLSDTAVRSSADLGTLYHAIMRECDVRALERTQLLARIEPYRSHLADADVAYLSRCLQNTASDEFRMLFAEFTSDAIMTEVPFVVPLGAGTVRGQIDVLCDDGEKACVIDYKTTAHDTVDTSYILQLELYAYACHRIRGVRDIAGLVYFPYTNTVARIALDPIADIVARFEKRIAALQSSCFDERVESLCPSCMFSDVCARITKESIERSFV